MTYNEELKDKLMYNRKNGWEEAGDEKKGQIYLFCDKYIEFLNLAKTERESIIYAEEKLKEKGFKNINECKNLKVGDKVYYINREKSAYIAVIGKEEITKGINIVGAHIDAPRIDLKPNPVYEDKELALLKTHYYGGIKKYQWTCIPLSIHGVIYKANGEKVNINIGEDDKDPIFTITDLLPHLAKKQMEKKLSEGIEGEDLNVLIGGMPINSDKESEKVKLHVLKILNDKYGIVEEDFISAELELVPAFKAQSLGFDKSMIAGYGQDDRSCSFTSLMAILEIENPEKTAVCMLVDKEEVGSMGNTGMESHMFDWFIMKILDLKNENKTGAINETYANSKVLSADVDGAYDPTYASVVEKQNASYLAYGLRTK